MSLILNLLVTIQARTSAIQAFVALSPSCWEDVDNYLKGKYSWISSAYEWILVRWFLTTLKIPATYMIDKIGPMQLPCRTPKSISKLLKEFWLTRTHRARQDRKGEFHFFALPTTSKSISKISYALLQWRAERRNIFLKQTLKTVYFKGSGMKYLNMNLCKWSVPLALTKTNSLEIRQPNGDIFYGQSLESQFIRRIIQDHIVNWKKYKQYQI